MEREQGRLARRVIFFPTGLLLLIMGMLFGAHAQTSTVGSISGTVRDPQGGVIPKAEVTLQEERTGFVLGQSRMTTDSTRLRVSLSGVTP